ncbi:hypothetical protein Pfo_014377 [Paulownia fortunei]|nr:hypothetical protein Pfo_014377 [Paulownia fortunei]
MVSRSHIKTPKIERLDAAIYVTQACQSLSDVHRMEKDIKSLVFILVLKLVREAFLGESYSEQIVDAEEASFPLSIVLSSKTVNLIEGILVVEEGGTMSNRCYLHSSISSENENVQ